MAQRRSGRVYRVVLVPPDAGTLFPSQDEYIEQALDAGRRVERYGREWIVGGTVRTEHILTGRIGFRGAEGMAELWDEETRDFREVAVPAGMTAPWAVDLRTLQMALQPRGSVIKLNGLIGAFRALLTQDGESWKIQTPEKEMSFATWRESVDRVLSVRFRLRQPNPHWEGADDLQAVMDDAEAEVTTLELKSDAGLNTDAPFLGQSQHHVERGYGESRYTGLRGIGTSDVRESVYNSALGSEEESIEVFVGADGEVAPDELAVALAENTPTQETEEHEVDAEAEADSPES